MNETDTIAALATPAAPAARAIIRTSGPRAIEFFGNLVTPLPPSPGTRGEGRGEGLVAASDLKEDPHPNPLPAYRERGLVLGEDLVVPASVLVFHAPRSSTGEDVVEYHVPGSPWIVARLLDRLFALGARQAEAGEFTSRAFFNAKLDLSSAEGVVATIAASNRAGLDAARQLLAGELSRRLVPLMDRLANALALVEIGIDFSEEDVSFIAREKLEAEIGLVRNELASLLASSGRFERLDHEPRIVLAGRPNAGKSSLLNVLAGRPRAIVADVAGTTRDALSERVALQGGYVTIVDVAGLEGEAVRVGDGSIDHQMRAAAESEIARADHVVLVVAADDDRPPLQIGRTPDLVVRSKSDLATVVLSEAIVASTRTADGLDEVLARFDELAFPAARTESAAKVALNARHQAAIDEATAALDRANDVLDHGAEIIAAELRAALTALGSVLGKVAPDDVLGRIFSSFCIGK